MLQYKIPQNVGIEDKIVGPFSLRQLIILAAGGGISYILFAITSRLYELNVLEYILIVLPALFALALAMLKIHNVSFGKYLLLTLEFAIKPKKRLWDHRGISALVAPDLTEKSKTTKEKTGEVAQKKKNVNLKDLSITLDSGGFEHVQAITHDDIDQVKDDDLITAAYFDHKKGESKTENMYWRTRDVQKKKLDFLAKQAKSSAKKEAAQVNMPQKQTANTDAAKARATGGSGGQVSDDDSQVAGNQSQNNQTSSAQALAEQKNKRKRRRKKPQSKPVRPNMQINTTSQAKKVDQKKSPSFSDKTESETSFDDLQKGGEIEFNLD